MVLLSAEWCSADLSILESANLDSHSASRFPVCWEWSAELYRWASSAEWVSWSCLGWFPELRSPASGLQCPELARRFPALSVALYLAA